MAVIFKEDGHIYESLDENLNKDKIKWTSVTTFISKFKPKFDADAISKKSCKNKRSKWFGLKPKEVRDIWKNEGERAIELGNWYHNDLEQRILDCKTIEREGVDIPIIKPIVDNSGIKIAPKQKLSDGMYPEHFAYLKSACICGQADLVTIVNGKVNITDYKTNKEIKEKGFRNWEGITHYNIQLSLYMYIILKHNPKLKPGKLIIQHVKFEETGRDKYDYPITKYVNKEPILKELKMYELPYLKDEVRSLIMWLKENSVC